MGVGGSCMGILNIELELEFKDKLWWQAHKNHRKTATKLRWKIINDYMESFGNFTAIIETQLYTQPITYSNYMVKRYNSNILPYRLPDMLRNN